MPNLPWDMRGKVVVITGGNAGIGLGFARGIAKAGGGLVIWGRRKAANDAAKAELEPFGTRVLARRWMFPTRHALSRPSPKLLKKWAGLTAPSPMPG